MPLFEMTPGDLVAVPSSTFEAERVLERTDLQRLLRAHIDAIVDDVLVISEEFGAFADARRRIDLLGIDPEGRLVVFELKRTADGGHLELQALRYAAMVSTMTSTTWSAITSSTWHAWSLTRPVKRVRDWRSGWTTERLLS